MTSPPPPKRITASNVHVLSDSRPTAPCSSYFATSNCLTLSCPSKTHVLPRAGSSHNSAGGGSRATPRGSLGVSRFNSSVAIVGMLGIFRAQGECTRWTVFVLCPPFYSTGNQMYGCVFFMLKLI